MGPVTALNMRFWGGTVEELERLAGPLSQVPGPATAYEVLQGRYRGEPIRAIWMGRMSSDDRPGATLHLAASVGARPISTYVWARKGSSIFGPTAETGDTAFDKTYIAAARPQEVVSAALDADVRAMIERRWPARDTSIDTDGGWVKMTAGTSRPGPRGTAEPPTAAELQSALDDIVLVAGRLRSAYDDRRAQLAAEQGEAAAQAWEQAAEADLASKNRTGRMVALGVLVGVLIAAALITWVVLAII